MTVPQEVKLARHGGDLDDDGHEFVERGVTTETDTTLRLAPDGAGGVEWGAGGSTGDFVSKIEGGQETINAIGATGAAEDIDPTLGNVVTATLGDDTAFTILEPVGSAASTLELWIETGAGGFTPTIDADGGSFVWDGTTPTLPTGAAITYRIVLERIPGTTNDWVGDLVGDSGSGATFGTPAIVLGTVAAAGSTDEVIRRDSTIVAFDDVDPVDQDFGDAADPGDAAFAARSNHRHGMPADPGGGSGGHILITDVPAGSPLIFADLLQNDAGTDLLYADA